MNSKWIKKYFVLVLLVVVIFVLRSPEKIFNAQLWAEDGTVFFKDAFELSIKDSLFKPHQGYLQVIQRFIAEVTVHFKLYREIPLIWNFLSIISASLILALFCHPIYTNLITNEHLRYILVLVIASGGQHPELMGNLANLQWYIAITGIHLLVYLIYGKNILLHNFKLFLICLLVIVLTISSPQLVIFVPAVLYVLFKYRKNIVFEKKLISISYFTGVVFQLFSYSSIFAHHNKLNIIDKIPNVLYVFFMKTFIQNYFSFFSLDQLIKYSLFWPVIVLVSLIVLFLIISIVKIRDSKIKFLFFCLLLSLFVNFFVLLVGRSELFDPKYVKLIDPQSYPGGRYFYFGFVSLYLVTLTLTSQKLFKKYIVNFIYIILLFQILSSVLFFKNQISFNEYNWSDNSNIIKNMKTGDTITIPINPDGWIFSIIKTNKTI